MIAILANVHGKIYFGEKKQGLGYIRRCTYCSRGQPLGIQAHTKLKYNIKISFLNPLPPSLRASLESSIAAKLPLTQLPVKFAQFKIAIFIYYSVINISNFIYLSMHSQKLYSTQQVMHPFLSIHFIDLQSVFPFPRDKHFSLDIFGRQDSGPDPA